MKKIAQDIEITPSRGKQSWLFLKWITNRTAATERLHSLSIKDDGEVVKWPQNVSVSQMTEAIRMTIEDQDRKRQALESTVNSYDGRINTLTGAYNQAIQTMNSAVSASNSANNNATTALNKENQVERSFATASTVRKHPLTYVAARHSSNEDRRRLLTLNEFTRMWVIHLDFYATRWGNVTVARLPADAPTPQSILEAQKSEHEVIYIEENSREIKGAGMVNGRRYIIDLVWFF